MGEVSIPPMKKPIGSKLLLVTVLTLLSVGFIAVVYATDIIETIRPEPNELRFIREIDQDMKDTTIMIKKDGEIIGSMKRPHIQDRFITIRSPFGKTIGMMSGRFNVTVEEMKEVVNQASEIALADEEVKQIIGDNNYTLRGIPLRLNDSNVVKLFLRMTDEHYIITVDLDQEKVTSIEPAEDCKIRVHMRRRLLLR